MNNKLTDLNNHLFAQLERLSDEDLKGEELETEINRAKAITSVSTQIIQNGTLLLAAKRHLDEYGQGSGVEMPMLGITSQKIVKENKELKKTVANLQSRIKKSEEW